MATDDERKRIADAFAQLGGRRGLFDSLGFDFSGPRPPRGARPARVTASVEDPRRFHVVPEARVELYRALGWVTRASIKSDDRVIARVLEWPGAAVSPDDVGPHPAGP